MIPKHKNFIFVLTFDFEQKKEKKERGESVWLSLCLRAQQSGCCFVGLCEQNTKSMESIPFQSSKIPE